MLVLKDLTKIFPKAKTEAISHINAKVPPGKLVGLTGPDGAGKTTLLRLIAGLLLPTSGEVIRETGDSLGYMPQKFGLYEDLTVLQNFSLYADLQGLGEEEKKETFDRLLKFTGLTPFVDRLAKNLSGGMKQKLGLACALIQKPSLLLLDEPSVGVDPISRRELWMMVEELLEEGVTVIWSTSYLDEAEKCHEVLLLNEGKLLYQGAPKDLEKRVEGRVFKITEIQDDRRHLLFELLKLPEVMDATIQGSALRILTREALKPDLPGSFKIEPETPRFEDAFIDILGGGPGGKSELAEIRAVYTQEIDTPIIADHLTKKFGEFTAANDITFSVKRGEIFGLLGPNGAGKTTTFKMLCGLLKPTSGKALVNGLDLSVAPAQARAQIGYMAQKFSLYNTLTVKQNLSFFSGIYANGNKKQMIPVDEMIRIFSMQQYLDEKPDTLPLGIKQRLALACANMHNPPILFLDEPTSGVDPITRREFWNHINGLVQKGVTVMVTTHFMDEAEYCDRIALVYRGEMIHMDTPDALKAIARRDETPNPTLEDTFIHLIKEHDAKTAVTN